MSGHDVVRVAQGTVTTRPRGQFVWTNPQPETITFTFAASDPAAVTLRVNGIPWTFDRTLLEEVVVDVSRPLGPGWKGVGDVKVERVGLSHVKILLSAPEGEARLDVRTSDVAAFCEAVGRVCPEPVYDVDAWLERLTGEGAS